MENNEKITDNFVTYPIALALKNMGFDEPCFGRYWHDAFKLVNIVKQFEKPDYACIAPLWQDAIDWFEKTYQLEIITKSWKEGGKIIYLYSVNKIGSPSTYRHGEHTSETRLFAMEKGILKAIELCQK